MLDRKRFVALSFLSFHLVQLSSSSLLLKSLLPAVPLQPPESWAWGQLQDGQVFVADQNMGGQLPESLFRELGNREKKKLKNQDPQNDETDSLGPELSVSAADIEEEIEIQESVINVMEAKEPQVPIETNVVPELSVAAADMEEELKDQDSTLKVTKEEATKPLEEDGDAGDERCTNLSCLLNVALDNIQEIINK